MLPLNLRKFQFLDSIFVISIIACTSAWGEEESRVAAYQTEGVGAGLPVFADTMRERLTFPLAWKHDQGGSFAEWRKAAQAKVKESWLSEIPRSEWNAEILDSQTRQGYVVEKISLNITADSRVLGLICIPEGPGPFPAVLLLHDHGAEFRIGKEKMIESWDISEDKLELSREWVKQCYDERFVGDVLAQRGYVCLCIDALNWSDRGGGGYEGQQALASNLMQLGVSYAGLISQEDLAAAEFLAQQPQVERSRIAALGFSMGACRCWHVAAMSEHVQAGICICSMACLADLLQPGTNITRGQSAFTMLHPGLSLSLDYPDVASIACPKPMLFFGGRQDKLTPVEPVEKSYQKMQRVWSSQGVASNLTTKLWDVGHVFSRPMQDEAFAWLDHHLGRQ